MNCCLIGTDMYTPPPPPPPRPSLPPPPPPPHPPLGDGPTSLSPHSMDA